MRRVTTALGALLLSAGNASALPLPSHMWSIGKMLLKGWEAVKCSEEMHTLYPTHTERYVLRTSTIGLLPCLLENTWRVAVCRSGAPPRIFGYTLLGKPGIGLCVPPNIESNVETDHRPKPNPFVDSPVAMMERIKDWIHHQVHFWRQWGGSEL